MNTPNPLMPQGALETQANNKRSMIKIVVSTILAVHGVVLGGLLFLGCKEEGPEAEPQFAESGLQNLEPVGNADDDPFAGLGLPRTDEPVVIPGVTDRPKTDDVLPPLPPMGENPGFTLATNRGTTVSDNNPFAPTNASRFAPREPVPIPNEVEEMTTYVVLPGDTFTHIAQKHNLKPSDISAANPGVDSRRLQVGDVLNLPPNVRAVTPSVPEAGSQTSAKGTTYIVKSGDTLNRISRTYGVSVKALQEANGIKGSRINVGQKLVIPVPSN